MTRGDQEIRTPKSHFTMIPNLYDDSDLDVFEFRLLAHFMRVGKCTESTRTTAKKCHMSIGTVVKKRKSLAKRGWIKTKKKVDSTIRVVVIDKWLENTTIYGGNKAKRSSGEHERESRSSSETACSSDEQPRSSNEIKEDSVKKTITKKKESIRENENWDFLFDSLAETCSVDPKTAGASLAKISDILFKAGYRDVDVKQFGRWWLSDDFRKRRGIPPTLWQLREQIAIVRDKHAKANAEHGQRLIDSVEERSKRVREELGLKDGEKLIGHT
jgi:hypothetical protein